MVRGIKVQKHREISNNTSSQTTSRRRKDVPRASHASRLSVVSNLPCRRAVRKGFVFSPVATSSPLLFFFPGTSDMYSHCWHHRLVRCFPSIALLMAMGVSASHTALWQRAPEFSECSACSLAKPLCIACSASYLPVSKYTGG